MAATVARRVMEPWPSRPAVTRAGTVSNNSPASVRRLHADHLAAGGLDLAAVAEGGRIHARRALQRALAFDAGVCVRCRAQLARIGPERDAPDARILLLQLRRGRGLAVLGREVREVGL